MPIPNESGKEFWASAFTGYQMCSLQETVEVRSAPAAKMARTIWAVTAKEQSYQRGYQSVRPSAAVQAV